MTGTNAKRIPGPGGATRRLVKGESSEAIPKFAIGTKVRKVRSKDHLVLSAPQLLFVTRRNASFSHVSLLLHHYSGLMAVGGLLEQYLRMMEHIMM